MNGAYEFTPYLWPLFVSIFFLVAMSLYSWHRRSVPGAIPYTVASLSNALFMVAVAFEVAAVSSPVKAFWYTLRIGMVLVPVTAMFFFAVQYAGLSRPRLTRRALVVLVIPPLLLMLSALTNDSHHLLLAVITIDSYVREVPGPLEWVFAGYGFLLSFVIIGILVWLFIHSPAHRLPAALVVCGVVMTRIALALNMAGINPVSQLDFASASLVFAAGIYAIALFGFRMFDSILAAHKLVIEQMQEGVLVLDTQGRIVSLNPAAGRIFESAASQIKGRLIHELLPACSDRLMAGLSGSEIEIDLMTGPELRHYTIALLHLKDGRRLDIGRLLMLRDITKQKHAQARLLEHQRTLAIHNEREHLARELHDSLGQALAATHLQASTAKLLFVRGENAQVSECLDILADTALQAEVDMREYLLGTHAALSVDQPFFGTLRQFVGRYSQQYHLPVEISVPPELEERGISQSVAIQLLRIIQEALSNVRKHAGATSAKLTFKVTGDLLQIAIGDDGQGFDPAATVAKLDGGFGLRSMRERVEELDGCLEIISQPGRGTQVIVKVPLTREI
jgi:signal transduction histidine kinase